MTEKQIFRRMSEAYETFYGDKDEDEWYGEDDATVWRFYRPSEKMYVKMKIIPERKCVDIYESYNSWANRQTRGAYSWR